MSGILQNEVLTIRGLEDKYGWTERTQTHMRNKMLMPYSKVGDTILYSDRLVTRYILSAKFAHNKPQEIK